jgi:peptidoglycan/LPS O-acetylase OafA/YrhL
MNTDWFMIFWVIVAVIAICAIFFRYRESVSRDRTIQTLAEKGQPIPPELIRDGYHHGYGYWGWRYRNPFRTGIILICVGIAIFLSSAGHRSLDPDNWHDWSLSGAVFPLMIGVALLVIGMFDRRPPPPPAP